MSLGSALNQQRGKPELAFYFPLTHLDALGGPRNSNLISLEAGVKGREGRVLIDSPFSVEPVDSSVLAGSRHPNLLIFYSPRL